MGSTSGDRPRESAGRRRIAAAIGLIVVVGAGLLVHVTLPDTPASDIAGDALYAIAACLAVVLVAPRLPALAAGGIAMAWCVGVELFQLTGLPLAWGAEFAPIMLVLGTVFDSRDLWVYVVTIALVTVTDAALLRVRARPRR